MALTEPTALTDAEWRAFQAIPEQGYSHRHWVDHKIARRVEVALAEARAENEQLQRKLDDDIMHLKEVAPAYLNERVEQYRRRTHEAEAALASPVERDMRNTALFETEQENARLMAENERLALDIVALRQGHNRLFDALTDANRRIEMALRIVAPPHPGDLGQSLYHILSADQTEQEPSADVIEALSERAFTAYITEMDRVYRNGERFHSGSTPWQEILPENRAAWREYTRHALSALSAVTHGTSAFHCEICGSDTHDAIGHGGDE